MDKDELRAILIKKVDEFVAQVDPSAFELEAEVHEGFIVWLEEYEY